jgi:hypothetical protein
VLTSITKGDDGTGKADSGIQIVAYYGGVITAPLLTTFQDSDSNPNSSLSIDSISVLTFPELLRSNVTGVTLNGITQVAQNLNAFPAIPSQAYGEAPFTITPPTASSNLAVTVTVVSGPAKISGYQVTLTGIGTVKLAAHQPGDLFFTAAAQVNTTFTVAKGTQTISFPAIGDQTYGAAPITLSATSTSGLAVKFTLVSGPGSVTGNTLTLTGAGKVVVRANQAGNADYAAAPAVSQTITVAKASQTITFPTIANRSYSTQPDTFALNAEASSGLALTFTTTGPVSVANGMATVTGTGAVSIKATQPGNADYTNATEITRKFTVTP